jgi:NAD(P)-dependent dehydrogenase (short-subunit alcohol dehydrogenase family)
MSESVLADKTSIVTGADGGIGQAISVAFAAAGAKVACLDIDFAAAEKAAATCGRKPLAVRCDVSSEAETMAAAAVAAPARAAYCTSKGAIIQLAKAMGGRPR